MGKVILGTILKMQKGKKPVKLQSTCEENFLPYVDIKAFEKNIIDKYTSDENCLSCEEGDLLIVCDGSRSGLTGKAIKGFVGSTLAKISADGVLTDYLHYFLQGRYQQLNTNKKGTGTPHLNSNLLKSFEIIVPEIAQQHRIVAKIEELFSELDKGVSELQKVKAQLKVYRQAVLKEAFEEITPTSLLADFFEITGGLTKNRNRDKLEIRKPYLRVANVYYNRLDLKEIKLIGVTEEEISKAILKSGDLLIVEGNGSPEQIGRVAVWSDNIKNCLHQNHIIKGRPLGQMLSQYALYFLISVDGRQQILDVASSTSGLYTLSVNKIKKLKIPVCSREMQQQIVSKIESRLSVCDKIEQTVDESLKKAEHLRQSILKQAFEGKLV